jgi:hypothetical protein
MADTAIEARVENPFPDSPRDERLNMGAVTIESQRVIAEVKAAMTVAKACPRNKHEAMEKILETCRRFEFAQTALYAYDRGGSTISDASIRLAEVLANAWTNLDFGIKELAQDVTTGESEMFAFAWDLETNVRCSKTFPFKHERHTRQGVTKLTDPRDIYEMGANLGARRLRACILAIIDADVKAAAVNQCRVTIAAGVAGNKKTLTERVNVLVQEFGKRGIKVTHIEHRLGHPIKDILPEEFVDLGTVFNSIKEEMSHPSDWFDVPKGMTLSEKAGEAEESLKAKKVEQPAAPVESLSEE